MSSYSTRVADLLLDMGVVNFNSEKPFIFTSGWASPVYIDCRKIISFLHQRREIMDLAAAQMKERLDLSQIDFIAGGETAGIAYAAWLSELLGKPMLYVRKKPKGFGRGAQIEGDMPEGARVLLVEDLTTDGGSKITFANVLRAAGAHIEHAFSVFYYGIYDEAAADMQAAGLTLHYLATWKDLLAQARARGLFDEKTLFEVESFLKAPADWSRAHGGAFERAKAVSA